MKAPRIQNLMRVATVVVALALGGVAAQAQPGGDASRAPQYCQ